MWTSQGEKFTDVRAPLARASARCCINRAAGGEDLASPAPIRLSRSRSVPPPAAPAGGAAGNRAPVPPRPGAPIPARRRCGSGGTPPHFHPSLSDLNLWDPNLWDARRVIHPCRMSDRDPHCAPQVDTVGPGVQLDQHRQCMRGARRVACRPRHRLGLVLRHRAGQQHAAVRPRPAHGPASRAITPRRNTCSAPGRCASRAGDRTGGECLTTSEVAPAARSARPARRPPASGRPRPG